MTSDEEVEDGHDQCREQEVDPIERWIPYYLRRFVAPYHDEFCYTHLYHFRLVAALMMEGFLPIATEGVILPKLHHERSVIPLPEGLHVSKSIRKKSKRFRLTVNEDIDRVVEGCRQQHGRSCWLYPDLVKVLKDIHDAGRVDTVIIHGKKQETAPVRLYSIEVWNDATGELAAGELGYTVGSIYTSLTGFSAQDSAGSVQLISTGRLLSQLGFKLWDLGMDMEYKRDLGSTLMKRKDFVAFVAGTRVTDGNLLLPATNDVGFDCKSLVDQTLSLEAIRQGSGSNSNNRQECKHANSTSSDQCDPSQPTKKKRTSLPDKTKVVVR